MKCSFVKKITSIFFNVAEGGGGFNSLGVEVLEGGKEVTKVLVGGLSGQPFTYHRLHARKTFFKSLYDFV